MSMSNCATSVCSSSLRGGKRASCSVDALAREGCILTFFVCVFLYSLILCVFVVLYACLNIFSLVLTTCSSLLFNALSNMSYATVQ